MPPFQRIRDPLHNIVPFRTDTELENVLWSVIQTRPFQRLRRVKQLGFSDLVYPGATHSRFSHSVGVFHTARQLLEIVRRETGDKLETPGRIALAAALVHDLGHGPFSHAFETVGKRLGFKSADHEILSDRLIRESEVSAALEPMGSGFATDVANMVKKEGRKSVHNAVVSSQFDADRLDYMRRDRLMTGTQHAAIDFEWLLANLTIAPVSYGVDNDKLGTIDTFVIGPKAIYAAEAYVLGLFQLYPTVYMHKATRGAEKLFVELMVSTIGAIRNGDRRSTGLPPSHPLVRYAKNPDSLDSILDLDDAVIWASLDPLTRAKNDQIASIASRLKDRKLYKCIDIRLHVERSIDPNSTGTPELVEDIDRCCASIHRSLTMWIDSTNGLNCRVLLDEAERSPYKIMNGESGPIEQINVLADGHNIVDLKQRSRVVASLSKFKLMRAYFDVDDSEARRHIEAVIEEELEKR